MEQIVYDYVIVGSGFGGSVSAMRLTEKGYSVLVLEKGKRFDDQDFARSNWQYWKYLWLPFLRAFGILQISVLKGAMILHGVGVGGGSLGYSNVLEIPTERILFHTRLEHACRLGENTPAALSICLKNTGRGTQSQALESR